MAEGRIRIGFGCSSGSGKVTVAGRRVRRVESPNIDFVFSYSIVVDLFETRNRTGNPRRLPQILARDAGDRIGLGKRILQGGICYRIGG